MGAAQTAGECDSDSPEWKQPTEDELGRWRRIQTKSCMIRQLSLDVDAQYHCYQPYLLLSDIIHLHRTCHLWRHWIRSPGSVAHRSQSHEHGRGRARNRSDVATIRNSEELFQISRNHWIQPYLYGCRISPPINDRSNSWLSTPSIFQFRLKSPPPPLLTQLADLKQIQHLTLDHVHPNEITSERIKTYFTTLAPTLSSLELFPTTTPVTTLHALFGTNYRMDADVDHFLEQLHLLLNLEELRITIREAFRWSHLDQLCVLPHFHTFVCTNEIPWISTLAGRSLARCLNLKHCSFGRFLFGEFNSANSDCIKGFLLARHQSPQLLPQPDPLEFLDLSTICIRSDLWRTLAEYAPNLTTLDGHWYLAPDDWPLLREFKRLKHLHLTIDQVRLPIEVKHLLFDLIHCPTIETLTLGSMEGTMLESHLRSLLSHLPLLTDLTLSMLRLENVAGFSEPNRLLCLVLNYCHTPIVPIQSKIIALNGKMIFPVVQDECFRATLPTIPTLIHLTLLEASTDGHGNALMDRAELVHLTRQLFQRHPKLVSGQFAEKMYKRSDLELDS